MENVFNILTSLSKNGKGSSKSIAKYLIEYDGDFHDLKVSDVSEATYTSPPTVTRFSKKIGYPRFAELRIALINSYADFYGINSDQIDNMFFENHLNSVVTSLEQTKQLNSKEDVDRFVEKIINADVINIYSLGETAIVAKDFQLKLIRIGFNAVFDTDKHTQHFCACNSNEKTLAIGISYSAKTEEVMENLELSKKYGATTFLIGSKNIVKPYYVDNVLNVSANESISRVFSTTSRFSLLFLLDIVYHELINRDIEYYRTKLDETRMIRREN